MLDLEQIFGSKSIDSVTEEHMVNFVDALIDSVRDTMIESNVKDVPLTTILVTMCSSCNELHETVSQLGAGEDHESVTAIPQDEIFFSYCSKVGKSIVGMGQVPVAVGFIAPVKYLTEVVPDDIDESDPDKVKEYARALVGMGDHETGEALIMHVCSVNGIRRYGLEFAKHDVNGFIKPEPGPEKVDKRNLSVEDDGVVEPSHDTVWAGIDMIYEGAKEALMNALMGESIGIDDGDIDIRTRYDDRLF
jgi:hypothetical protein